VEGSALGFPAIPGTAKRGRRSVTLRFLVVAGGLFLALALRSGAFAQEPSGFQRWLAAFQREAITSGISEATVEQAFRGLSPLPKVIELDRRQPELILTLEEYLSRVVTDARVSTGRSKLKEYSGLLERIHQGFGVEPHVLVALWAVESDFGRSTGDFPVIAATATLAYEGRRAAFFRRELLYALRILERGDTPQHRMLGSWAGAMGQFQFMPSSLWTYALDHDGDGRIDVWHNLGDAFASAANYLSRSGWEPGRPWGWEVRVPPGLDKESVGLERTRPVKEWQAMGVRLMDGSDLREAELSSGSILQPDGTAGRSFLVGENYRVLLKWNRSHHFAIAVGILARRIQGG